MPPSDPVVQLSLPRNFVGQILDGLDVLIEQWDATAAYFRTGEVGDVAIRECSGGEEAEWIAGFYREISEEMRRQTGRHDRWPMSDPTLTLRKPPPIDTTTGAAS